MPLAVVYAGTPEFAVPALEALIAAGHYVRAVYTRPDRPVGRGRALAPSAVKRRALELGLAVHQPTALGGDAAASLTALAPDIVVVVAYGLLLPPSILAVPRLGCLNVHASLLPRWRGAAPIARALQAGDAVTGISIMRMEPGLDTGAVYHAEPVAIEARDTAAALGARLAAHGALALLATLADVQAGAADARPQPAAGVSYARKLTKTEARLDWSRPAVELDRQVRAFVPWPVADTRWRGVQLRVHQSLPVSGDAAAPAGTVVATGADGIDVATGEGLLRLVRVQLPGRNIVTAAELAAADTRGRPLLGALLGSPA